MRLIDADAFDKTLSDAQAECKRNGGNFRFGVLSNVRENLRMMPTIEQLQPKKGHWEMKEDPFGLFDEIPVCSECGCMNDMRKKTAFCEHCGADMKEGDGE